MNFEKETKTYSPDQLSGQRRNILTPYSGLGKLPPQSTDLEEAVLGAVMLEKEAFYQVNDYLTPECFYRDNHQKIYYAIKNLFNNGSSVDILTVTAQLRKQGELEMIGGAYYITELTNRVASAANIEFHARVVYQKYLQRELIRISSEVVNLAYEDTSDVFELLEGNQLALMKLSSFNISKQSERIDSLIDKGLIELDKPVQGGLTGVGTGFISVDDFTAGWQRGDLNILAARPAMGKTSLAMQWARNAAVDCGMPTAVFSLEMTNAQLTKRMIANEAEIFLEKINKRIISEFDRQQLDGKLYKLRHSPLHIDDTPNLTTVQFRTKCIRLKKLYEIQLIIVDYLQLMRGITDNGKRGGNREQEIGEITRCLKTVAKELDVPVIALSQLSRNVESRPGAGKRPQLQDLRESGNIEQDADNVMFLFRPEYYGLTVDEHNNSTQSMAELIWAKHRMGETGTLLLKFRGALTRFENWVPYENMPPVSAEDYARADATKVFKQAAIGFEILPIPDENEPPF